MLQKPKFKTQLDAAIAHLKGIGAISSQEDVSKRLEIDAGVVSSYKNGKKEISSNFVEKFETEFKIKLSDFSIEEGRIKVGGKGINLCRPLTPPYVLACTAVSLK